MHRRWLRRHGRQRRGDLLAAAVWAVADSRARLPPGGRRARTSRIEFRYVDAAVIRVAASSASELALPPWPEPGGEAAAYLPRCQAWLRQVRERRPFADAIELASPVLAHRIDQVCDGQAGPREARRAVESAARYLLRLTSRATPFGLFAGVAPARIGTLPAVQLGGPDRAIARPDATWLAELITRLETQPELLRRLPVVASNLAFSRADRLILARQPPPPGLGRTLLADVSVRDTEAVRAVMRAALSPVTIGELAGKLGADFGGTSEEVIEQMLSDLVWSGFLITSLHPPMNVTDPLGYLIEQLDAAGGGASRAALVLELHEIRGLLSRHNDSPFPGARRELRRSATRGMLALCDRPEQPLAVDLRLDGSVTLPSAVARDAESAASALTRLAPHPAGNPAWLAFHARFLGRYGPGAVVSLSELINADTGIGYPAGYRGSEMEPPVRPLSGRDRKLLHLAQQAALDGRAEIVISERDLADLEELAAGTARRRPALAQSHTGLRFRLHAPTAQALGRGEFTLVVTDTSRQAGATIGRFLYLVDARDRDRMIRALNSLPTAAPGALTAQICSRPLSRRAGNLARVPAIFPLVPIAQHLPAGDGRLPLDDLAVGGDEQRLFLVSRSLGRLVEPVTLNAVEFRRATHPLARFLAEITTALCRTCIPFDWGAASGLPFLPRIRHGRAVLSSAHWNLPATALPGPRAAREAWAEAWRVLKREHRIPDAAYLGSSDVRIRLDLTNSAHLAFLRADLDRTGSATLTEAESDRDYGWIAGRAHEIDIPLAVMNPPAGPSDAPQGRPVLPVRLVSHPGHAPGNSPWLSALLYGHSERQSEILTGFLPDLWAAWDTGQLADWWFLRGREPEPHLRLRVRLGHVNDYGTAARCLGEWADRLRSLGLLRDLVLDTYYPETGRYGAGSVLEAAEAIFAADSAAAIAQLAATAKGHPHPQAMIVASLTAIAADFTGGANPGWKWLASHVSRHPAPAMSRDFRNEALCLADPAGDWAALRALSGADRITAAWSRRKSAVTTYRARLLTDPGTDPDAALTALLRAHHTRMAGTDPGSEQICLHLARASAISQAARITRNTS
jgi:thiopeptide-type bacteriocin biosynthesis protein